MEKLPNDLWVVGSARNGGVYLWSGQCAYTSLEAAEAYVKAYRAANPNSNDVKAFHLTQGVASV